MTSHQSTPLAPAGLRAALLRKKALFLGVTAIGATALVSFMAISASPVVTPPPINLSADPLYAATAADKPTMALALSVEFPTLGAQYQDAYSSAKEYLGYYDAESCYTYNDNPAETPATGKTKADYKRFDRSGPATNRQCANAFSGNFLNWASNSAIDMLRLALSGGDRYIDESNLTILQRAVLPNGDPVCFWNSSNFPAKELLKDGGSTGAYWGAVPASMKTQANGSSIWVANTLNGIYFGTSNTGGCNNVGDYTLGSSGAANAMGPKIYSTDPLPSGAVESASEGGSFSASGVQEVWYGAWVETGSGKKYRWYVAPAKGTVQCTNGTFGDPWSGVAKKCYVTNYSGSWTPPSSAGLNSDGFFYSRVQVCKANSAVLEDVRDYGLCKQYPNGNYKPTGVIQKYADQIRLAAFGYLMDQTASYSSGRYGGVLRAPMKYVGQKKFDIYGREDVGSNPKAEWDNNTGIFTTNPEGDPTFGVSGVINYLNQFGRTGPQQGRYKKYDPVGELYYQALRYLQGLPPTPDAISSLGTLAKSNALYDGYPVYTDWSSIDPYGGGRSKNDNYACLKSNIVVIGDINTHDGDWRNVTPAPDKNVPNFKNFHTQVRTYESSSNSNGSAPSSSQKSQIMGYAYWAHANDIRGTGWTDQPDKQRPGLRVKTFIFDVNEYGGSTDLATRSKSNQFFMASKYGGFETDPANPGGNPYNNLTGTPDPHKDKDGTVDKRVWQRPDGDASTYYLQSNARGVLKAFDDIFNRASTAALSIAGSGSQSNVQTATSANQLYTAQFDTSSWTGDVTAKPITTDGGGNIKISTAPDWSAAARLKLLTPANRKIYVGHGSTAAATSFTWADIGTSLQGHLNKASPSATADGNGQKRLNYLRGDRSEEGSGLFRTRSELLGDIVNSGVTYSASPTLGYTGSGYAKFRAANDGRMTAVFAGANDGMLHAFAAKTDASKSITAGDELFAYIPSWMGPKLSALTSKDYVNNHQAYVDGPSTVGEVQVANSDAATDWKTVLVSGTGAGGRGVFALDVSKPESFGASNVMWEFTPSDDDDIGYVVGRPQLLKFKTGANTYRWFAAVASGVNNYDSTFSNQGGSAQPALFLLALDKAAGASWAKGTNYFKISFPVDSTLAATNATGMANYSALWGSSGEVTHIYAGDFHGRVWKLDFTDSAQTSGYKPTSDWNIDKLSSFNNGTQPYPFYIAKDSLGNVQPITAAPGLFTGPVVGRVNTFYVVVGTGKYLESGDNTSTRKHSVYVLYDDDSTAADSSPAIVGISGRSRLQLGTVDTTTNKINVTKFTWGRPKTDGDTTQRSGWYFDLPGTGEKLVYSIRNLGSLTASFSTLTPGTSGAVAACSTDAGTSKVYTVNVGDGGGSFDPVDGITGELLVLEKAIDTGGSTVTPYDSTGRATRKIVKQPVTIGTKGVGQSKPVEITETIGRLSWRQIYNYQDLKNK